MPSNSQYIYNHCPILHLLPPKLVHDYIEKGLFYVQRIPRNKILHFEGDVIKQVELIISGEIAIERIGEAGDIMTVNRFSKDSIIGSNLIFSSINHYPMTITAKSDSQVLIIPKDLLFDLCKQYPDFLLQFIQIISDLSVTMGFKMKNRISRSIRDSIITYINKQYALQNTLNIQLTMTKKSLSEMFGISRTSLSRELQKMKEVGLIDYDNKTIIVLDPSIIKPYNLS